MTTVRPSPAHVRRSGSSTSPRSLPTRVTGVSTSPHFWAVLVVASAIVIGNLPYLLHLFDPNPLGTLSGLGTIETPGVFTGSTATDPNVGYTAQALGHLSAVDWLHGHVPWWNPFEGLGSPLAGEMQAASFFPPTVFLLLSNGQVLSHLTVELVAALSTYFLLRRLSFGKAAAVAGGIAFGLNGTFSWLSHAPANPVAFLPLLLLGVEIAADEQVRIAKAWVVIGIALALSICAGFPETAYIDGLLVGLWVVIRAVQLGAVRRRFLVTIAKGVGVGLLLAAPLLIAFFDYLPQAYVGSHSGAFGSSSLPNAAFSQAFLPYIYGPINGYLSNDATGTLTVIWGSVGGYVTFSVLVLALIGLYGSRLRPLRFGLLAWTIVALGRSYGVQPFHDIVNALPGMSDIAFFRYSNPSWEFALIVLAAFGLDDMARRTVPRWWIALASFSSLVFLGLIANGSRPELHHFIGAAHHHAWAVVSVVGPLVVIGLTIVAGVLSHRVGTLILVSMVAVEAVAAFAVPELSAPRSVTLNTAPVSFLQHHLGNSRFYTIYPIQPNYGSYFGVSSLDVNDLPVPKLWANLVPHHLDFNGISDVFNGSLRKEPAGPAAFTEFVRNLRAFESAGVKYLVVPSGMLLPAMPAGEQFHRVFSDRTAQIYRVPSPVPMYTTHRGACTVRAQSIETATVSCTSPQMLVRHELYMKGWNATVNGHSADVAPSDTVYQQVRVPAGTSEVTFNFTPPYMIFGYGAFLAGVACLVAIPLRRSRPREPAGGTPAEKAH